MQMLVRLLGARRAIEVGVFTGYSSLAVDARDADGRAAARLRRQRGVHGDRAPPLAGGGRRRPHRARDRAGAGRRSMRASRAGEAGQYDFAFIDADKTGYLAYYERLLKLLRPGGLIVVDNTLWSGEVANPANRDADTVALREFNDVLHARPAHRPCAAAGGRRADARAGSAVDTWWRMIGTGSKGGIAMNTLHVAPTARCRDRWPCSRPAVAPDAGDFSRRPPPMAGSALQRRRRRRARADLQRGCRRSCRRTSRSSPVPKRSRRSGRPIGPGAGCGSSFGDVDLRMLGEFWFREGSYTAMFPDDGRAARRQVHRVVEEGERQLADVPRRCGIATRRSSRNRRTDAAADEPA